MQKPYIESLTANMQLTFLEKYDTEFFCVPSLPYVIKNNLKLHGKVQHDKVYSAVIVIKIE